MTFRRQGLGIVAALISLAVGAAAFAQGQDPAPKEEKAYLDIGPVVPVEAETKITFEGRAALPDGAKLSVGLYFGGAPVVWTAVHTKEGRFSGAFQDIPFEKLVPGDYLVQVKGSIFDQSLAVRRAWPPGKTELTAEKPSPLGNKAQAQAVLGDIKKFSIEKLRALRRLYDKLNDRALTTIDQVKDRKGGLKEGESLPKGYQDSTASSWDKYCAEQFDTPLADLAKEVGAYQAKRWASPTPTADKTLAAMIANVGRLRKSYTKEILKELGAATDGVNEDRTSFNLIADINGSVYDVYKDIPDAREAKPWNPKSGRELPEEKGRWDGTTYQSTVSGFQVAKPDEKWKAEPGKAGDPERLIISNGGSQTIAMASIQVMEFPDAKENADLIRAWENLAKKEWPNYQKIDGREFERDGTKGYDLRFSVHEEKDDIRLIVRSVIYFSKRNPQRVYGIVMTTMFRALWGEFAADFQKIEQSFKIIE